MKELLTSFRNAWHGILKTADGKNFRIQLLGALWALLLCLVGQAERWKWAAVALACVLVLGAECMSNAAKRLCDRMAADRGEPIAMVKDLAAGGVLICVLGALGVAVTVFGEADFWKTVWYRILYDGQAWSVFLLAGLPVAALSVALPSKKTTRPLKVSIEEVKEEDGNY